MASGSSGRTNNSASKGLDFASDDILCSYEEYGTQDEDNGTQSDPANSAKEFHKSRMARPSVFPAASYSPPEESSFNQDVITSVEGTMKKYTDNLMRFLEGISSRLSQLELYCYNLDKSIGEMRTDLVRDHEESEARLKSLEKHIQEVHRSVQILKHKQELANTHKELAKLQLAQKESSLAGNSVQNKDGISTPASEAKASEHSSDSHDQQLALVPHQAAPQPSLPAQPVEHQQLPMAPPASMPPQNMVPGHAYYLHPPQTNSMTTPSPPPQNQYLPAVSQIQDPTRMAGPPHPAQTQLNQNTHVQQYPPQWPHQFPQPGQPPQQPLKQPQIRGSSQVVYSNYLSAQANQSPAEMTPSGMHMQVSFPGTSQTVPTGSEAMAYGFVAAPRPVQQQTPTQHVKTGYGASQPGDGGYMHGGPHPSLPPGNTYMVYEGDGGRMHQPPPPQPHYQQNAYPPTSIPLQNAQRMPPNANIGGVPHPMRSHPYNELIEKLVSMGYRGDHVLGTIQRLEENGQPIDFNSVLDRLNGHTSGGGGPQRGWSG